MYTHSEYMHKSFMGIQNLKMLFYIYIIQLKLFRSYEIMEKYKSCSITIMSINDKKKDIVFKSENKQDSFNIKVMK